MPLTHTRRFRVRFYECDPYGHLNHATYLRFMQEAAFTASAEAGYDLPWYDEVGQQWLIRETEITYLQPVFNGQTIAVRTWVEDFRRVRSRRRYELIRDGDDALVAQGVTEWVYVDSATFRPVAVPAAMIDAFFPEGRPVTGERRDPLPAPAPPPAAFVARRRVLWRDLDPAAHVNNANYVAFMEDAGIDVLEARGWPMERMTAAGFGLVARQFRVEYLRPAVLGDELAIATWITDARRATAVRHYAIRRAGDNALLARGRALWVWVDLASGRPIRIPEPFREAFAGSLAT